MRTVTLPLSSRESFVVTFAGEEIVRVDFVQTVWSEELGSVPGTMSQRVTDSIAKAKIMLRATDDQNAA